MAWVYSVLAFQVLTTGVLVAVLIVGTVRFRRIAQQFRILGGVQRAFESDLARASESLRRHELGLAEHLHKIGLGPKPVRQIGERVQCPKCTAVVGRPPYHDGMILVKGNLGDEWTPCDVCDGSGYVSPARAREYREVES